MKRPSRRTAVLAALLAPVLLWAAWVVPVNLLLSYALPGLVGLAPDPVFLDYERAWTVWPNRIHVRGFNFSLEDRAIRLHVAAPAATLGLSYDPRLWRDQLVGLRNVQADAVVLRISTLVEADALDDKQLALRPDVPPFAGYPLQTREHVVASSPEAKRVWGVDLGDVTGSLVEVHIDDVKVDGTIGVEGDFVYRLFDRVGFDLGVDGDVALRLGSTTTLPHVELRGRGEMATRSLPAESTLPIRGALMLRSDESFAVDSPLGRLIISGLGADVRLEDLAGWSGPVEASLTLVGGADREPVHCRFEARAAGDGENGALEAVALSLWGLQDKRGDREPDPKEDAWSLSASSSRLQWGNAQALRLAGPLRVAADRGTPLLARVLPPDVPTPWVPLFPLHGLRATMNLAYANGAVAVTNIDATTKGIEAWGDVHAGPAGPTGQLRLIAGPLGLLLDIGGDRDKPVRVVAKTPRALRDD